MKPYQIVCFGRPAVDYLLHDDITRYNLDIGEHRFVEDKWLLDKIRQKNLQPMAGGSMGNTAWVLGRLGIPTSYIGAVGEDPAGKVFATSMKEAGVGMPGAFPGKTKQLLVIIGEHGERSFLGTKDDLLLTSEAIKDIFPRFAAGTTWALVENYSFKLQPEAALEFMHLAKQQGCRILMTLPNHHILKNYAPILQEAENIADIVYGNRREMELWIQISGQTSGKAYLQTLDAEGACWRKSGEELQVACQRVNSPVDVNGAGDSFLAGFLAGQINGLSIQDSMKMGHKVARITIGQLGPRPLGLTPLRK